MPTGTPYSAEARRISVSHGLTAAEAPKTKMLDKNAAPRLTAIGRLLDRADAPFRCVLISALRAWMVACLSLRVSRRGEGVASLAAETAGGSVLPRRLPLRLALALCLRLRLDLTHGYLVDLETERLQRLDDV